MLPYRWYNIGTNVSSAGFENGSGLTGISTNAKVGSGNTVFLSNVASEDFGHSSYIIMEELTPANTIKFTLKLRTQSDKL